MRARLVLREPDVDRGAHGTLLREPGVDRAASLPRLVRPAMTLDRTQGTIQVCINNGESRRGHDGSVAAREAACCLIFDLPSAQCSQARRSS